MSSFWPTADHWSTRIPLATPHPRLRALDESGFVALSDAEFEVPDEPDLAHGPLAQLPQYVVLAEPDSPGLGRAGRFAIAG